MHFRCEELQLIDRCHPIDSRPATIDEILLKHTKDQYDLLKSTENESDENKLEELSSHYDAIYIHPVIFQFVSIHLIFEEKKNNNKKTHFPLILLGSLDIVSIIKIGSGKYN